MTQLQRLCRISDKRFTDEQIKVLLQGYCRSVLSRAEVQEVLGRTRFFVLLKRYRQDPEAFTISYRRTTGALMHPTFLEALTAGQRVAILVGRGCL